MRKNLLLVLTLAASAFMSACSSDEFESSDVSVIPPSTTAEADESLFPVEGGGKLISSNGADALNVLLKSPSFKMENATTLHNAVITQEQWDEIKAYVDKNLRVEGNDLATYNNVFRWCFDSLTYSYDDAGLEPYDVFTKRRCVCQGYANLCKTMLLSWGHRSEL